MSQAIGADRDLFVIFFSVFHYEKVFAIVLGSEPATPLFWAREEGELLPAHREIRQRSL